MVKENVVLEGEERRTVLIGGGISVLVFKRDPSNFFSGGVKMVTGVGRCVRVCVCVS